MIELSLFFLPHWQIFKLSCILWKTRHFALLGKQDTNTSFFLQCRQKALFLALLHATLIALNYCNALNELILHYDPWIQTLPSLHYNPDACCDSHEERTDLTVIVATASRRILGHNKTSLIRPCLVLIQVYYSCVCNDCMHDGFPSILGLIYSICVS